MRIVKHTKNKLIVEVENEKDIFKAFEIASKKLKNYTSEWDYKNDNYLVFKKKNLKKCELCGKKDILEFEFDNGKKIYKICGLCWLRLNG